MAELYFVVCRETRQCLLIHIDDDSLLQACQQSFSIYVVVIEMQSPIPFMCIGLIHGVLDHVVDRVQSRFLNFVQLNRSELLFELPYDPLVALKAFNDTIARYT